MKKYKEEEVFKICVDYFGGDELAARVWIKKYALKDTDGNILENSPKEMHRRLAKEIARIESKYPNSISEEEIFELLKDFKYFVPAGSPMSGIGNEYQLSSLLNCFVIGNNNEADSYGSVMRSDEEQVQIMKRRGGVGQDISHIRPSGSKTAGGIMGDDMGMVLYMQRFSNSTKEVAQDGRRGALMLSCLVNHPDSGKFVNAKKDKSKVTGANISVKITDKFMDAVVNDKDFIQTFPIDLCIENHTGFQEDLEKGNIKYDNLIHLDYKNDISGEYKGCYAKRIKAKNLWDNIISNNWTSAEPGALFWDKIIEESPADSYKLSAWKSVSSNPCGEIILNQYGSCNLSALNLKSYVVNPFTSESYFDWILFKKHAYQAQRFLDDIIDLEIEKQEKIIAKIEIDPESDDLKSTELGLWNKILKILKDGRRTGLGITAEGDMTAALGLKYGTVESIEFSERVHKTLAIESYKSSINMAIERGSFEIYDTNVESKRTSKFLDRIYNELPKEFQEAWEIYGRRNIANLTIAPTGTTSLMTQTTSGIEPVFSVFYKRRRKVETKEQATFIDENGEFWEEYNVLHKGFVEWFMRHDWNGKAFKQNKEILEKISEKDLQFLFEHSPYYKATANDVDWVNSVKMQGTIQKWIDHSISKTVNVPKDTTKETIGEIYMEAYKSGCKGVTVYRDGCRDGVLITNDSKSNKDGEFKPVEAHKRPKEVECDIFYPTINKSDYIVFVGVLNGFPYEVFAFKYNKEAYSVNRKQVKGIIDRKKSGSYQLLNLKKEVVIEDLSECFETPDEEDRTRLISCSLSNRTDIKKVVEQLNKSKGSLVDFSKIIARQLKRYIKDGSESIELCPECNQVKLVYQEGCLMCPNCGYSKCG